VYVPDEKFLQDFSYLSISTKGQKKKLARYILRKLEEDASNTPIDEDGFSIEHILPESPGANWFENFTDVQIEEFIYRLGNLTLLKPALNRQIGNETYSLKLNTYQRSVYTLTKNILAEQWTANTIAARQEKLSQRAVSIWRADFVS
ncbi:MAG: HNH endonuclease family protein, partial [Cyanobacteria bacterium J06642_3]